MGWGTTYKYDGYLSRIHKDDLENKREELVGINDMIWREILAYMAMTPPVMVKDDEGNECPWPEFIAMKIKSMRDELEENEQLIARIDDCIETLHEHPEDVNDD